jgi:hypothetical protein
MEAKKKPRLRGLDAVKAALTKASSSPIPAAQFKIDAYWLMMLNDIQRWEPIGPKDAPTGVRVEMPDGTVHELPWE